jgi:hypothetical protein
MTGLVFYEKSHRYKLDGKWVPGVTTLIKGGFPAPALMYWSARSVAEYVADNAEDVEALRRMGRGPMVQALKEVPWEKRDVAAVRGTDVHDLAEKMIAGAVVEVPDEITGYVEAAARFMDEWGIEPLIVERPVAHRAHWWAGTGDVFARCADGRLGYFDYKTGESGIWPETAFQAAAYTHAEFWLDAEGNEQPLPTVDFAAAVWLRPDEYQVIPVRADDAVYREFRHIAFVAEAAKRAKGNKTTPGYVGLPLDPPNGAAA